MKRRARIALALLLLGLASAVAVVWMAGSALVAPNPGVVYLPPDLGAVEAVVFSSGSGSQIRASFLPGEPGRGAVLLLHGVRATRQALVGHARWLARDGYAVLFMDFQAHGESPGEHVTFGHLESRDAQAAVAFLKSRCPGEKVGVIGMSMGGAAAVLANPPLPVDAMVLEQVYPTITEAVNNRLAMRLGAVGPWLSPLLTVQLRMRLGIGMDDLRPIAAVGTLKMPKLFVAGTDDLHTTLEQSEALYAAAAKPKELWVVEGAKHEDLCAFAGTAYAERVGAFLSGALR